MDYIRTKHSVYLLTYHMIFVTKYRKPVITDEIGDFIVSLSRRLCLGYGGELISGETDKDHVHLLISLPPTANVALVARSLKTQISKEIHLKPDYNAYVQKFLKEGTPFWSPSYFVATTGTTSLEKIKAYIEEQRTDEHKRKYEQHSSYWAKRKSRTSKSDKKKASI